MTVWLALSSIVYTVYLIMASSKLACHHSALACTSSVIFCVIKKARASSSDSNSTIELATNTNAQY